MSLCATCQMRYYHVPRAGMDRAARLNDTLYVCGGFVLPVAFDNCYVSTDGTWREGPPLRHRRWSHSLTAVGDQLVAIGGFEVEPENQVQV